MRASIFGDNWRLDDGRTSRPRSAPLGGRTGDVVGVRTPGGEDELEIAAVDRDD